MSHFTLYTLNYALHSTLYTPHSTLHTSHSTLTQYFTLCTPHSTLHALHSTLYTPHSTLYTPHSALYTPHSTLYTPHSTLYTPHFTLYTPHSTFHTLHSTLYTLHFALHTLHSTLYTWHSTLHTLHFTRCTSHSIRFTPHSTFSHVYMFPYLRVSKSVPLSYVWAFEFVGCILFFKRYSIASLIIFLFGFQTYSCKFVLRKNHRSSIRTWFWDEYNLTQISVSIRGFTFSCLCNLVAVRFHTVGAFLLELALIFLCASICPPCRTSCILLGVAMIWEQHCWKNIMDYCTCIIHDVTKCI